MSMCEKRGSQKRSPNREEMKNSVAKEEGQTVRHCKRKVRKGQGGSTPARSTERGTGF